MISKFARISLVTMFCLSHFAMAQAAPAAGTPAATAGAPAATPNAPSAPPAITGTKIGTINIEQAIFASNEGRRDFEALSKKFEPKQTELKGLSEEIDSLKKQLNTQGEKMNDDAKAVLVKQIESKQKSFDRTSQDAQEEFNSQRNEIGSKILSKLAPIIQKYVAENGYGLLLDTSQPWPQGPVIVSGASMDITQPIVEAYNVQSGVPAPAAGSAAAKPVRSAGSGAAKPTPPPATKPATPPAAKPPSK
jgi:outer membrane protein